MASDKLKKLRQELDNTSSRGNSSGNASSSNRSSQTSNRSSQTSSSQRNNSSYGSSSKLQSVRAELDSTPSRFQSRGVPKKTENEISKANKLMTEIGDYLSGSKYTSHDSSVRKTQSYKQRIKQSKADLDKIIEGFGSKFSQEYKDILQSMRDSLDKAEGELGKASAYWKQFGSEDEYNKAKYDATMLDKYDGYTYDNIKNAIRNLDKKAKGPSDAFQTVGRAKAAMTEEDDVLSNIANFFMPGIKDKTNSIARNVINTLEPTLTDEDRYGNDAYKEMQWLRNNANAFRTTEDLKKQIEQVENVLKNKYGITFDNSTTYSRQQDWNHPNYAGNNEAAYGAAYSQDMASSRPSSSQANMYHNGSEEEVNRLMDKYDELQQALYMSERKDTYTAMPQSQDFTQNSAYIPVSGESFFGGSEAENLYKYINDKEFARQQKGIAKADNQSQSLEKYIALDNITDEERATFNYIYNTQGGEAAKKYLDEYLMYDLNARNYQKTVEEARAFAKENPVGSSILSIPQNVMSGLGYASAAGQGLSNIISGENKPVDWNTGLMANTYGKSSTVRDTVANDVIGGGPGAFMYQTVMSMGDSVMTMPLGPWLGAGMLGGSAATNAAKTAKDAGATDGQALMIGALEGAAETVFEHFSLGSLKAMTITERATTIRQAIKNMVKQGTVEGSEELFTTLANTISEEVVLADLSTYNQSKQRYIEQGYSEAEAEKMATMDWWNQLGQDTLGGAMSGFTFGFGGNFVMNNASIQSEGRRVDKTESADALITSTLENITDTSSRAYQLAQTMSEDPTQRTTRNLGKLAVEVDNYANRGEVQNEEASKVRETMSASNAFDRMVEPVREERASALEQQNNEATLEQTAERKADIEMGNEQAVRTAPVASNDTAKTNALKEHDVTVTRNGKSERISTRIEVTDTSLVDDSITLKLSNGEEVNSDAVQFRDKKTQKVVENAKNLVQNGWTADQVQTFIDNYDGKQDPDAYTRAFRAAVFRASVDNSKTQSLGSFKDFASSLALALNGDQIRAAYSIGVKLNTEGMDSATGRAVAKSSAVASVVQGNIDTAIEAKRSDKGTVKKARSAKSTSFVYEHNNAEVEDASKSENVKALETISKALGIKIIAVDSLAGYRPAVDENGDIKYDENGKVIREKVESGANGKFDRTKGAVYISLDADNPLRVVLAHELTHFIQQYSPKMYEDLKTYIRNYMNKTSDKVDSFDALVEAYIDTNKVSRDIAIDEVVADACDMFFDSNTFTQDMANELARTNQSLAKKIREFIEKLLKSLASFLSNSENQSFASAYLANNISEENLQTLKGMWDTALANAVKTYNAMSDAEMAKTKKNVNKDAKKPLDSIKQYSLNARTTQYIDKYMDISEKERTLILGTYDAITQLAEIHAKLVKLGQEEAELKQSTIHVHMANEILHAHPEIWDELIAIRDRCKELGIESDFVSDRTKDMTVKIDGKKVPGGLKGLPIEYSVKEDGTFKFLQFKRTLPQIFMDNLNPGVMEDLRKIYTKATEQAYEATESDFLPDLMTRENFPNLTDKEYEKVLSAYKGDAKFIGGPVAINTLAGRMSDERLQSPIRSAEKTLMAINLNSACPMFTIGNHGCYLDACYLTQMGMSGNGVNLFAVAFYSGEVLQLTNQDVAMMNAVGGLRINGLGDTIGQNKGAIIDILKHAGMRGLKIKIITKQMTTFDILEEAHKQGVDLSHVTVQPSMDYLWIPVELDDAYNSGVRGLDIHRDIREMNKRKNKDSFDDYVERVGYAYEYAFQRATKVMDVPVFDEKGKPVMLKNGKQKTVKKLCRKYGFSADQINEMMKKYDYVKITPRYVVCTAEELAETALNRDGKIVNKGDVIQTLMHGVIPKDCFSEYGGEILNFGSARHVIEKDANGNWDFYGEKVSEERRPVLDENGNPVLTDKGNPKTEPTGRILHKRLNSKPHKIVLDYVREHYTPEEQNIIWTRLKGSACCQSNDFKDACAGCQSLCAGGCGLFNMVPGQLETETDFAEDYVDEEQFSLKGKTTEQIDADYLDAVKRGDKATAQRMVDEYAATMGYTLKVYHHSPNSFTVFKTGFERHGEKGFNNAYYFTPNKAWAKAFGREERYQDNPRVMELYLNPGKILDATNEEYMMTVPEWFAFFERNGIEVTDAMRKNFRGNAMPNANTQKLPLWALIQYDFESGSDYETDYVGAFKKAGYDSVHMPDVVRGRNFVEGDTYMVWDKARAKSANAITYDSHKKPIPLSQRFNKNEDDIRYSLKGMTDEQIDADYMKAVESGDMETAQRMVDEYARMKGYSSPLLFHGTDEYDWNDGDPKQRFRVFKANEYIEEENGISRIKGYFTEDEEYAHHYGTPFPYYVKIQHPLDIPDMETTFRGWKRWFANKGINNVKFDSAIEEDSLKGANYGDGRKLYRPYEFFDFGNYWNGDGNVTERIEAAGYDGIRWDYGEQAWMPFNANAIKSADPVAYDKNGNIIPLSQRFNEETEDVYYSLKDGTIEGVTYINDGTYADGSTIDFIEEILNGNKKGETRPNNNMPTGWRGLTKRGDSFVYGRVRFGKPVKLYKGTQLYKDSMIEGTNFDIEGDGFKYYYPILEVEDFRDEPRPLIRKGLFGNYDTRAMAQRFAEETGIKLGETDEPQFQYSLKDTDSMSNREILAGAFDVIAQTDKEKEAIERYRESVETLDGIQAKLDEARKEIHSIMFTKGGRAQMGDRLAELQANVKKWEKQLTLWDGKLIRLQASKPIRDIVTRARANEARQTAMKYRERIAGVRDSNAVKDVRRKLQKLYNDLKKKALHPTEGKYIPAPLMNTMLSVLETIDYRGGREDTKIHAKLTDMYLQYQELKKDEDYLNQSAYDEELNGMLDELIKAVGEKYVRDMNRQEINEVYRIVRAIAYTLNQKVKQIGQASAVSNYELGERAINEINNAKGPLSTVTRIYNMGSLSPMRFFRMISGWARDSVMQNLAKQLNDGQRKMNEILMQGFAIFDEYVGSKSALKEFQSFHNNGSIKLTNENGDAILDRNGKEVYITHDMLVSLYLHMMNEDNRRHILGGGIRVPDLKAYSKGKGNKAYTEGDYHRVMLTQDSLERLFSEHLTEYDKRYAQTVYNFFNTFSKQVINETSMALNGYKKAEVDNYFPIHVDGDFLGTKFDSLVMDGTLEGMGILKQRVNSAKPIYLEGASDAVIRNLNSIAKYGGLAIPIRNFDRVYNVKTIVTENGEVTDSAADSVKEAMNKWGDMGKAYISELMSDLQYGTQGRKGWDTLVNKFFTRARGKFAQATLAANLSVTLKQAASYPTAASELGWAPLAKALMSTEKMDLDTLAKYTPIMWIRSHGFVNTELGDAVSPTDWSAKVPGLMGWIQKMDIATVTKLGKATEFYVRQMHPELKVGSDDYWRAVADKFNDVVEKTQPNYSVMQRPEVLRSQNAILRSLTMFMTQRLQNYNILFDAVGEFRAARSSGDTAWMKTANRNLRRAVTSQVVAAGVIAAMTMAVSMLMHRMKRYRDDDDEITAESFMGAFFGDMLSTVVGSFLGGSEVMEIANNFINGTTYDVLDAPNISMVNDLIGAFEEFGAITQKIAEKQAEAEENGEVYEGDADVEKLLAQLKEMGFAVGKFFGVPADNVEKLAMGVYYYSLDAANGTLWESDIERTKTDYYKQMAKALEDGDIDRYNRLHDKAVDLIKSESKYTGDNAITDAENTIAKGLKTYLKKNDERIRQAAEARINSNNEEYGRIRKELIAEGYPESAVVGAINDVYDEIKKGVQEETVDYVNEYAPDVYENSDIVNAYRNNNPEALDDIVEYYITEKGMTETEARAKIDEIGRKEIRTELYDAIDNNDMSTAKESIKSLQEHGAENSDISSSLTSTYKDMYLDYYIHSETGKMKDLESKLHGLGLTDKKGKNYFDSDKFKSWISKYQEGTKQVEEAKVTSPSEYYKTVQQNTSSRKGIITAMSKKYHPLWEDYYLHDDTENLKKLEDQLRRLNITDSYGRNHYDDSLFAYWREQANK